jgi:hypothetical protein
MMNPSVEDRLASAVRALEGVILPALPADADLAREQTMLVMGHLQIVLAQLPATPSFEQEEAEDLARLARETSERAAGGSRTQSAIVGLRALPDAGAPADRTAAAQDAIDALLLALIEDGEPEAAAAVRALVLAHGAKRADKDRRWFAAMGFDLDYSAR